MDRRSLPVPAPPEDWKAQESFTGPRVRGGYEVGCEWRNGKATAYVIVADRARNRSDVTVRVNGAEEEEGLSGGESRVAGQEGAAWTRLVTSSAVRTRLTWALTVLSRMPRRVAMSALVSPWARRVSTSRSRG